MKKQKGSAILIAVLLVAAIGGIAFSFGRIFLLEAANATISENGIVAYYAAESGIEEGFLRYRYNRNAEVPFISTLGNNSVFRSDLDTNAVDTGTSFTGVSKATTGIADNSERFYDLRMGFIGTNGLPIYGHNAINDGVFSSTSGDLTNSGYGLGEYQFLKLAKDEAYKIDLSSLDFGDLSSNDIQLFAKYPGTTDKAKSIMYLKLTVDYLGNGLDVKEYKAMASSDPTAAATCIELGRSDAGCIGEILIANTTASTPDVVWSQSNLISNFVSQIGAKIPMFGTSKITLSIRPLFSDAYVGISTASCTTFANCANSGKSNVVPGPFTYITSTGYFGGATRTIKANIDRQSGTLYDLFDYVIFENL